MDPYFAVLVAFLLCEGFLPLLFSAVQCLLNLPYLLARWFPSLRHPRCLGRPAPRCRRCIRGGLHPYGISHHFPWFGCDILLTAKQQQIARYYRD